jgi:hypothetical protein
MDALTTRDRAQPRKITGKQPNKNTGTGRHGMDARGNELYPTPAPLTKALMREFPLRKNIWEPAAGMGHMAAPLAAAGHDVFCSDIINYWTTVEGSPAIRSPHNFLEGSSGPLLEGPFDIVTNPPFAISGDFVRKGLEFTDRVIILNRLAFLEGQARSDIMDKHLAEVLVFVNRPPMMHRYTENRLGRWVEWDGKKADSAITMAWFVFEREPKTPGTFATRRIRWLKSDL